MIRSLFTPANYVFASLAALLPLHGAAARQHPRHSSPVVEPKRIAVEDHWSRVTAVLKRAFAKLERVKSLHTAAARQIDSADYALAQLLHDLRPAMALPTDVSGLRAILAEAERATQRSPYSRHASALAA